MVVALDHHAVLGGVQKLSITVLALCCTYQIKRDHVVHTTR